MATKKSGNIFTRFFHEVYYRLFVLDPIPVCKYTERDGKIFIKHEYIDADKEKITRFLKRIGFTEYQIYSRTHFDNKTLKYHCNVKVVLFIGSGDGIQRVCTDAFGLGFRYVPKKAVDAFLLPSERKFHDRELKFLCFPHEVSRDYTEVTFCEVNEIISAIFEVNSKKDKELLENNWSRQSGFVFLVE